MCVKRKVKAHQFDVNVLHKTRHHREKTPEEIPEQRLEGDNTDEHVELEACATVGHSLKRNRRGDIDFRAARVFVTSETQDTRMLHDKGWRGWKTEGRAVDRPKWSTPQDDGGKRHPSRQEMFCGER